LMSEVIAALAAEHGIKPCSPRKEAT
jgi:hypothetical protein